LTHGGRVYNVAAPPPPPPQEGIIQPPPRPTNDAAGRIFLIFVDDLHLDFRNTGRIRELFKKISKELIHEGDMFGIVSTGPSSLSIDLTYDRKRLDQAITKITGSGLAPKDILDVPEGAQGPPEVRYRAHVAFSTANDIINNLAQVHNRRKAFIYVSNGYDFNPFKETRKKQDAEKYARPSGDSSGGSNNSSEDQNPFQTQGNQFYQADLVSDLSWMTRNANRANVTMYTIDPRGLVGMPDLDEKIDMVEWQDYVRTSQDSLRTIAELTGGYAAVNQNDFDKALKRIDAETSDYYVVGYYSNNPDPRKKSRSIDVKVTRQDLNVMARKGYTLRSPNSGSK
jgi:VWFA-related protein